MKKRVLIVLFSIVALIGAMPLSNVLATNTAARLTPDNQTIDVGATTTVALYVQNVQDLYAFQVAVGFDPAVLEVIDADAAKSGVQVGLGSFLQPDFVPQNNANNTQGAIVCVVTQIAPRTSVDGSGTLFTITFRGKAQGVSDIYFTDLKLARSNSTEIPTSQQDTQINVGNVTVPTATATPTSTTTASTATPTSTTTASTATPTTTPQPTATLAPGETVIYVVRTGDTLYSIARRFGVDINVLAQANNISNPSRIYVGQRLTIPRNGDPQPTPGATPTPVPGTTPITYVVQRGDTLYSIARRYGTTVQTIATQNHIVNPARIFVGQRLVIYGSSTPAPQPPPSGQVHVVQRGETLYSIARRYGTTVWAIAMTNHLYNPNVIYAGQRLIIP
jgi:LysM repeat protein